MQYFEHNLYQEEIKKIAANPSMELLRQKSIAITGARGLIGSQLIDSIMYANVYNKLQCKIYAIIRNQSAAQKRFQDYTDSKWFELIEADINRDEINICGDVEYFIHGASNTHPVYYSTKPVETILTNTLGTDRTLRFAVNHHCKRYVFLSSVEIYGENRGDIEGFTEDYCGYIDCNTLRAGYPESKRTGEALCQAYIRQYGLECVIPRIARSYGPGLLEEDSKALSQFIKKGVSAEDIVLKSEGKQYYSYAYAADVVDAIITLIGKGANGEAYNIVSQNSDITLRKLSELIAKEVETKVVYDIPDDKETEGYSKATKALLSAEKIRKIGWSSNYSITDGIRRTIEILKG